ncbi:conserved exported protein of unknown function [Magnetospirillum gryphiswaldense MSR-1 v2]|uniref:Secreted protein n=1 Tax=Magnetospirillum gryphiswaldense (strain DSM 6361 / JCM 21280 / NBRC 15271 / MSR-1) TaxID=431944 RepID=V6F6E0_MAGGM|nr:hypothetical protein [Magnetospirillum gryphiswaldense]CDL01019.1 conserved exported protein of unknown function [Magnetospirillum gryphiswaldense MSR-1 v2]
MKIAALSRLAVVILALAACAPIREDATALPPPLALKAVMVDRASPNYEIANLEIAVKPEGQGGISRGMVVRITEPVTVYRLWSGPQAVNAHGQTNRMGQWWSYDAPSGQRDRYRVDYEICNAWNDLTWVASCTLKAGAVVAIGPGQSVSEDACDQPGEAYPANKFKWQIYVDKAWARPQELECPNPAHDYANDPTDISKPLGLGAGGHVADKTVPTKLPE